MKRILVTGSHGQLGSEIRQISHLYEYEFLFHDVASLDICDVEKLSTFFAENKVDVIINCAAYTAVDKAETEVEQSCLINIEAVRNLAKLSKQYNAYFVHISTDYVFDGQGCTPYIETDTVNPQSVYGKSKLIGESAVFEEASNAVIFRTAWLYSAFGNNFVKTMQKYGKERDELRVVFDQVGTPTYAADLAKAILDSLQKPVQGVEVFHYSNEGVCSWYDFAIAIMALSKIDCKILPIRTKEYPTPAKRPAFSVLDKSKFKTYLGLEIPYWKNSLEKCLMALEKGQ